MSSMPIYYLFDLLVDSSTRCTRKVAFEVVGQTDTVVNVRSASGLVFDLPKTLINHTNSGYSLGNAWKRLKRSSFYFINASLDKNNNVHFSTRDTQNTRKFKQAMAYNLKAKLIGPSAGNVEIVDGQFTYFPPLFNDRQFKMDADVTVPAFVESLCYRCFSNSSIKSVTILGKLKNIPSGTFAGSTVSKIVLPNGLKSIDNDGISFCNVEELNIPSSVTHLGRDALCRNSDLRKITFNGRLSYIGHRAFYGCTALTSLRIPSGISTLPLDSIAGCTNLANVYIPESVIHLDTGALEYIGKNNMSKLLIDAPIHLRDSMVFGGANETTRNTRMYKHGVSIRYYQPKSKKNRAKQQARAKARKVVQDRANIKETVEV